MSLPVSYLPEAQDDIDATYASYEQHHAGLGDQFLEKVRERVDQISANPLLYAILHQDVRAAPLRRFPYVIYYRADDTMVLIVAVLHGRRGSRAWQRRV